MAYQDGFSGQLGDVKLTDLLNELASEKRSGKVTVGHSRYPATLWLKHGDLVDASCGNLTGLAGAYRALGLTEGTVVVSDERVTHKRVIFESVGELLSREQCLKSDWSKVQPTTPSLASRMCITPGLSKSVAGVEGAEERFLKAIEERMTIADAIESAKADAGALLSRLGEWVEAGVVEELQAVSKRRGHGERLGGAEEGDSETRTSATSPVKERSQDTLLVPMQTVSPSVDIGPRSSPMAKTLLGMPALSRPVDITPTITKGDMAPKTDRGVQLATLQNNVPASSASPVDASPASRAPITNRGVAPQGGGAWSDAAPTTERVPPARPSSSPPLGGSGQYPGSGSSAPPGSPAPLRPDSSIPQGSPLPPRPPGSPVPPASPVPQRSPVPGGSPVVGVAPSSPLPPAGQGWPVPPSSPLPGASYSASGASPVLSIGSPRVPSFSASEAPPPSIVPFPPASSRAGESIAPQRTVDVAGAEADDAGAASSRLNQAIAGGSAEAMLGRYKIVDRVGRGGMGTVYRAQLLGESGFVRPVAIKVLRAQLARSDGALKMFLKEANLASRLQHRNVVSVIDVGTSDGQPYLVMDYVHGHSLATLLEKTPREATPERIVTILLDALSGLEAIHQLTNEVGKKLGVVHNDISPENILVGLDGTARVSDLGVASLSRDDKGGQRGKPGHVSPERIRGARFDQRSDIFSIGVVMWNALTGQELYGGATPKEAMRNVLTKQVPSPSSVGRRPPRELDAVCLKALSRDPYLRYATAEEMLIELRRVAVSKEIIAPPSSISAWVGLLGAPTADSEPPTSRPPDGATGDRNSSGPPTSISSAPPARAADEGSVLPPPGPADTQRLPEVGLVSRKVRIAQGLAAIAAVAILAYVTFRLGDTTESTQTGVSGVRGVVVDGEPGTAARQGAAREPTQASGSTPAPASSAGPQP